jgi:hypothetical protein
LDVSAAIPIATAAELDGWLAEHAATESALVVALFKKASGRQTVRFDELQEVALCHGWVDTLPEHRRRAVRDPLRPAAARLELVRDEPPHRPASPRRGADDPRRARDAARGSLAPQVAYSRPVVVEEMP